MYKKITKQVGSFIISTNVMYVTDPCYKHGSAVAQAIPCIQGKWNASIVIYTDKSFGTRVGEMIATHSAYKSVKPTQLSKYGVINDSGQLGFFDEPYYEGINPGGLFNIFKHNEVWYKMVSDLTASEKRAGIIEGKGFASESGGLDGEFKTYIGTNPEGKIVAIKVVFIE